MSVPVLIQLRAEYRARAFGDAVVAPADVTVVVPGVVAETVTCPAPIC